MAGIVERLLPDVSGGEGRHETGRVTLDTSLDRLMKALTVWLPLLVSGTLFLDGITGESQSVFCYPPSNFSIPQANYLNAFCKESLSAEQILSSLFPYSVPLIGLIMYVPHFLWEVLLGAKLTSQITFISKQIENSFSRLRKLVDLNARVGREDEQFTHQKEKEKAREQMLQSISVLRKFVNKLSSKKLVKKGNSTGGSKAKKLPMRKIVKLSVLAIFAVNCSAYMIWFSSGLQTDISFVCNAKVLTSNDETNAGEYVEAVCKVIGVRHLYWVSILLSISFCIASPLPIVFVIITGCQRQSDNFLYRLLEQLRILSQKFTRNTSIELVNQNDLNSFSDFSIIGRLCGENRHLIPNLHMIMNMDAESLSVDEMQAMLQTNHAREQGWHILVDKPPRAKTSAEDEDMQTYVDEEEKKNLLSERQESTDGDP